jgi:carboxyl-terminal processing protease
MNKHKKYIVIGALGLSSLFTFSFVDNYFEMSKNLDIFTTLYKEVNTYYVDDIEPSKFMRTGIDAMLESLDPYTNYISEAETEDYRFQVTGQYGGIGATIGMRENEIMITEPYEGFPAQKEDLRPGDVLLEIDGKSMKGKNTSDVSKLLKGQPKTKVKLKIKREGTGELVKEITREEIHVKNVPYFGMINDNIGYIKLTGFTNDAGKEVKDALTELKKNDKLASVILDVRGNPGGLLHESVNVVNVFVSKGQEVVSTKGKAKEWDKSYHTLGQAVDAEIPLVVLTSRSSASASEIVSGTIQDLDRGVIIGQRTFGKGLVQSTRPLTYNSQLKVTTAKYYIPSGRCIQALDYSHRNEDGSVGSVPDSLKKEFKTKAGRKVYDGGGVNPDIETKAESMSAIAQSLLYKQIIFDFATSYHSKHATIAPARNFSITETDFTEFINFAKSRNYEYTTRAEQSLEDFRKKAEDEKYFEAVKETYEKMKQQLKRDKDADILKNKAEITELLEEEIARRYYFQKARVESSFDDDAEIQEAVKLFSDMKKYQSLLKAN